MYPAITSRFPFAVITVVCCNPFVYISSSKKYKKKLALVCCQTKIQCSVEILNIPNKTGRIKWIIQYIHLLKINYYSSILNFFGTVFFILEIIEFLFNLNGSIICKLSVQVSPQFVYCYCYFIDYCEYQDFQYRLFICFHGVGWKAVILYANASNDWFG